MLRTRTMNWAAVILAAYAVGFVGLGHLCNTAPIAPDEDENTPV